MQTIDYPEDATPLDPDEIAGLRFSHVTNRSQLDQLEQANIQKGLRWLSRQKSADILNETFIRNLHKKLFGEVWQWAGTFRKTEKNIGIDPLQIAIQLRHLLDDVNYWIENDTFDPIECAARLHHKLVYIHLFANGNGRHARIMADTLLTNIFNEEPIDWPSSQNLQTIGEYRETYISALRQADQGNYDALLDFMSG